MTDATSNFDLSAHASIEKTKPQSFVVENAHWGYAIRTVAGASRGLMVAQTISMVFGAAFLAGAIGMWLLPMLTLGADALHMRTIATILFVGLATLLLWYGTRGVLSQIQIDTSRGEIREVARSRAGRTTIVGCYGFDSVGGIFMEPAEDGVSTHLVLRYRDGGDPLIVATGTDAELAGLREQISRDVVVLSDENFHAVVSGAA